jgi:hypothetical protein
MCHGVTQDKERHERVIHTRVPETLEAELKERAGQMGISVSNLVRNVLANALGLVNDVVADTEQLVRSALKGGAPRDAAVIGWQPIVLEKNAICDKCNAILARGSDASIAIHDGPVATREVMCPKCLEEMRHGK